MNGRRSMPNRRFTKKMRLLRSSEFERVFAARTSAGDGSMLMYGATNKLGHPRLGLTVSRKAGGAVVRNRWKRVVREAFRLAQHDLPCLDVVCLPRGPAAPTLQQMLASFSKLAARIDKQLRCGPQPTRRNTP